VNRLRTDELSKPSYRQFGREQDTVQVVADHYGCFTYAADLAEAILHIALRFAEKKNYC
jgi:dTDP-4-dehydrorhamnose reductase